MKKQTPGYQHGVQISIDLTDDGADVHKEEVISKVGSQIDQLKSCCVHNAFSSASHRTKSCHGVRPQC